MTNNDRNTRTLIVCFVLSLFVLVPLRLKDGNQYEFNNQAVLGATTENQIVVPDTREALYTNNSSCIDKRLADVQIKSLEKQLNDKDARDKENIDNLTKELQTIKNQVCAN